MTSPTPLTEEQTMRFRALQAAVCQPHLNSLGLEAQGIDAELFRYYKEIRRSGLFSGWLSRQVFKLWQEWMAAACIIPRCFKHNSLHNCPDEYDSQGWIRRQRNEQ